MMTATAEHCPRCSGRLMLETCITEEVGQEKVLTCLNCGHTVERRLVYCVKGNHKVMTDQVARKAHMNTGIICRSCA